MAGLLVPLPTLPHFGATGAFFPYLGVDTFRSIEGMTLSYRDSRARNLIILVPAGECEDEADGRIAGQRDSPLTLKGRAQALAAGMALKAVLRDKGCHALFTSKMRRAKETLELFVEAAQLQVGVIEDDLEVRSLAALNDRSFGVMEGRTNERLIDEYGKELLELYKSTLSIAPIGGESLGGMMNSRVAPCLERTILPSVTGTVNRVAVVVAHPDALRAIQLSLSTRRTPTALADAMMRPGGPPRVVTVDRSGRYITAESVNLPPLPHLPLRHSSNSSTGSTATESSIATPPPSIHVAAPELAGSSKTTIEQHVKDHETYHDAELYIPLVSKPASGSRFIEGSLAALDPRIVIPGRRESWRNPISVNDASTFHGAQVSSVIRLAA